MDWLRFVQVGQDAFEDTAGTLSTTELSGHTDTVASLAFNSLGNLLATGGMEGEQGLSECMQCQQGKFSQALSECMALSTRQNSLHTEHTQRWPGADVHQPFRCCWQGA